MTLKPDKGQGAVSIDKIDYYNSMELSSTIKQSLKLLTTVLPSEHSEHYLNTLVTRGELTENDKMEMRPTSA